MPDLLSGVQRGLPRYGTVAGRTRELRKPGRRPERRYFPRLL